MQSFIPVPEDSDFPIQNLPYGIFRPASGGIPRVGVAIGTQVLDLALLESRRLLEIPQADEPVMNQPVLNPFAALGRQAWQAVRAQVTELLSDEVPTLRDDERLRQQAFHSQDQVEMLLPMQIGDYTAFDSSREHAVNLATILRGAELRGAEDALEENWLHLPVAHSGRASSIVLSGSVIHRPYGPTGPGQFGISRELDFELEMGYFIGASSPLGRPISLAKATEHIFGLVLLNDWSARDLQRWESTWGGPFLSKNFATTVSPWVVTLDALEPFRVAGPLQDPQPLPYLQSSHPAAYNITLEAHLATAADPAPVRLTQSNFRYLYWNICQQLAHHTISGCNLRTGDLLACGAISGPDASSRGSMLELAWHGAEPIELPSGERRSFLEDGDAVILSAWCQGAGYRIGFGRAVGKVLPPRT